MRIDSVNKLEQIYRSQSLQKNVQKNKKNQKDCIQISSAGKDMQIAKKAVQAAPEVRVDKVEEIKRRIASGTYNVSCEEIAEKMANSYFDHLI